MNFDYVVEHMNINMHSGASSSQIATGGRINL